MRASVKRHLEVLREERRKQLSTQRTFIQDFFAESAPASAGQKTLTNADVIAWAKAGIGDSTILLAIENGPNQFDTSPAALIELKKQGVSESVMQAMLRLSSGRSRNVSPESKSAKAETQGSRQAASETIPAEGGGASTTDSGKTTPPPQPMSVSRDAKQIIHDYFSELSKRGGAAKGGRSKSEAKLRAVKENLARVYERRWPGRPVPRSLRAPE